MMAELQAIGAVATSLKASAELAQVMIGLKVSAEVRQKAIELQTQISTALGGAISAQTAQMELLERVRGLEGDLKRYKDWEAEKQRYRIAQENNVTAFVLKASFVEAGEPPHALCPHCYQRDQKSILQPNTRREGGGFFCPSCNVVLPLWTLPAPPVG